MPWYSSTRLHLNDCSFGGFLADLKLSALNWQMYINLHVKGENKFLRSERWRLYTVLLPA